MAYSRGTGRKRRSSERRGLSLIEVMTAITITLLMLAALIRFFREVGEQVTQGRASLEDSARIRVAVTTLQRDLKGVTVSVRPWSTQSSGQGYFEIGDGIEHDFSRHQNPPVATDDTIIGDFDDYICMTVHREEPFVGRVQAQVAGQAGTGYVTIESNYAEIIYWLQLENDNGNGVWDPGLGELFTLRRRVLLIRPDLNLNATSVLSTLAPVPFWNDNDLSVHLAVFPGTPPTTGLRANSLADLSRRENRVAHVGRDGVFPYLFDPTRLPALTGTYEGEDVLLPRVLGFDVRVFDPLAPLISMDPTNSAEEIMQPGDVGFPPAFDPDSQDNLIVGRGAYVDLAYQQKLGLHNNMALPAQTTFGALPNVRSGLSRAALYPSITTNSLIFSTYDTWSYEYEHDGINQPSLGAFPSPQLDEGTDGFDNNNNLRVDEPEERETSPPYTAPLRGIRVTIRMLDQSTQQMKQMTVNHDFTPE